MGRIRARVFLAGFATLALGAGIACGGGDGDSGDPAAASEALSAQATASASATNTASSTTSATASVSPTAAEGTPTAISTGTETPAPVTATVAPTVAGSSAPAAPTAVPVPATAVPVAPAPAPVFVPAPNGPPVARMRIASLGVDYPIEQLATNSKGELDTPADETGAIGWYSISNIPDFAVPGTGGNAMFSAHVNYNGADGPFANLAKVASGAEIAVTLADGSVLRYEVFAKRGYVVNANYVTAERPLINMDYIVFTPDKPPGEEWITLMTCSCEPGRIIFAPGSRFGDCVDRDVVLARRTG